jgi:hypothetical protein
MSLILKRAAWPDQEERLTQRRQKPVTEWPLSYGLPLLVVVAGFT